MMGALSFVKRAMALVLGIACLASSSLACAADAAAQDQHTVSPDYAAWIPYWDHHDALLETLQYEEQLSALIAFAAIFDSRDQLKMLSDMDVTTRLLTDLFSEKCDIYLSVVNDIELEEGGYDNKTPALLTRLFSSEASTASHVEDLIELAKRYGVDGLEIDYEAIGKDTALWAQFVHFSELLYQRTQAEGLKLRIVLGWDAVKYASFIQGPEYIVMCYNLFGTHSGPGPKADQAFLEMTYELNKALPGKARMAFATGGFDWRSDGQIVSLTQSEAKALLKASAPSVEMSRDAPSAVLNTAFTTPEMSHEVWVADAQTLCEWRSWALPYGYTGFDLFRMGGNEDEDLKLFLNDRK